MPRYCFHEFNRKNEANLLRSEYLDADTVEHAITEFGKIHNILLIGVHNFENKTIVEFEESEFLVDEVH